MGLKLKACADCGKQKMIGRSKSRCGRCRKIAPDKFLNRPPRPTPKRKSRPEIVLPSKKENYGSRIKVLMLLGFESYADYLESDLWKRVRTSAFALHGSFCELCHRRADLIHHLDYSHETLAGLNMDSLTPLCKPCHEAIEFQEDGSKRNLSESQKEYAKRRLIAKDS